MIYTPDLITLDYVRQHRRMQTAETADNALLSSLISEASAEFQRQLDRVCMPYVATNVYDYQDAYRLTFTGDDLLAVTTLTNGDTTAISASNYVLRSPNVYPKWRVEIVSNASVTFTWNDTWHEALSIAGIWGYVPNYAAFWSDTVLDIPAGNLSASATSLTLASTTGLEAGMYVKVDNEVMKVTALSSTVATLSRAELGTTAAIHTAGAAIMKANVLPDIKKAVRELVVYAYLSKDKSAGRVTVYEGGIVTTDDLDPSVDRAIKDHRRKRIVSI